MTGSETPPLLLRPAEMADEAVLLEWRNDPVTRRMSLETAVVPAVDHRVWLERSLASPDRVLLVAESAGGAAVGMCRFDVSGDGSQAEVSINLAPSMRGRGAGRALLSAGMEAFAGIRPGVTTVIAVIRPENATSVRLFESAGFCRVASAEGLLYYERTSAAQQVPGQGRADGGVGGEPAAQDGGQVDRR